MHTEAFVQSEDRAWEERKAMATGETKRREVREGGINLMLNIIFFAVGISHLLITSMYVGESCGYPRQER